MNLLTPSGVSKLNDLPDKSSYKGMNPYILQILTIKIFSEDEVKPRDNTRDKIKAKFILSDGHAFTRALVMAKTYDRMNLVPRALDLLKISSLNKMVVSDQMLLILKDPLEVLDCAIGDRIGDPVDIKNLIINEELFSGANLMVDN